MDAMRRARAVLNKISFEKFTRHVHAFNDLLLEADLSEYNALIEMIGHHAIEGRGDFVILYGMLLRDLSRENDVFKQMLLDRILLELRLGLESGSDQERQEFLVIIELIGWLCRSGSIPPEPIRGFIESAFIHDTSFSLEAICRLLTVLKSSHEKMFEPYFDRLVQAWTPRFSNRLRFLILDLIELRERRWLPRRQADYLPMMKLSDFRHYVLKQPTG